MESNVGRIDIYDDNATGMHDANVNLYMPESTVDGILSLDREPASSFRARNAQQKILNHAMFACRHAN